MNTDFVKVLKSTYKNDITDWHVTFSKNAEETVMTTSLRETQCLKSNTDLRQMWKAILDELNCRFQEIT